jgi:hypothetical protein
VEKKYINKKINRIMGLLGVIAILIQIAAITSIILKEIKKK